MKVPFPSRCLDAHGAGVRRGPRPFWMHHPADCGWQFVASRLERLREDVWADGLAKSCNEILLRHLDVVDPSLGEDVGIPDRMHPGNLALYIVVRKLASRIDFEVVFLW